MKLTAFFFVCIIILAGCKEEAIVPGKDRTTLLTESPWRLVAEFQRVGALPAWGANSYFPSTCEADNLYRFTNVANGGFYHITEGPSKCIAGHPDTIFSAQWTFMPTNNILIGTVLHLIERLDDNNMVLVFPRRLGGREIQVRWVFVH
jgi:hypothetical protein